MPTDPNWPEGYSVLYDFSSDIKAKLRREKGTHLLITSAFRCNPYACWSPAPRKLLYSTCWWEPEDRITFFFLFTCLHTNILFSFANLLYLQFRAVFHLIFSFLSPVQLRRGSDRVALSVPSIQPRSTHRKFFLCHSGGSGEESEKTRRDRISD